MRHILSSILGMWSLALLSSQQGESSGGLGLKCLRKTSNKCLRESLEHLDFSVTLFAVQLFFFLTGQEDSFTTVANSFKVALSLQNVRSLIKLCMWSSRTFAFQRAPNAKWRKLPFRLFYSFSKIQMNTMFYKTLHSSKLIFQTTCFEISYTWSRYRVLVHIFHIEKWVMSTISTI